MALPRIERLGATVLAAVAYLAFAVALTWPVAARPGSVVFGDYGDTRGWIAWLWAKQKGFLDGATNPVWAAPFGATNPVAIKQPITEGLGLLLARAAGEVAAANLLVILALALTATATFALLRRLLHDSGAAFFGGLMFGFCPAAVLQALGGHGAYAFNAFLPLFLLALFHNRDRRSVGSAFLVATTFAGVTFTAIYFGYFSLYVAVFFLAFDHFTRPREDDRRAAINYLTCIAIAASMILPVELPAIVALLDAGGDTIADVARHRDEYQVVVYSSRFWDYLLPSIDHPVLGALVEDFVRTHLHGSNVFEQTLYVGFVPLTLFGAGLVTATRGQFDADHFALFAFFALAALWTYFLSLPPWVAETIPTISHFAYAVAPMFRAYVRFGVLVNLCVAGGAAVFLAHHARRAFPRSRAALLMFTAAAVIFEYWSVPPGHAHPVDPPPDVYAWLARQGDDAPVAEYPMVAYDEAAHYSYLFWQRLHGKRLINGASPDNPSAWAFWNTVRDLTDPRTPELLRSVGVRYVVVHKAMYRDGPIPGPVKRYYPPERAASTAGAAPAVPSALALLEDFGPDLVYGWADAPAARRQATR